jgi:antitoxin ParD1/3/4
VEKNIKKGCRDWGLLCHRQRQRPKAATDRGRKCQLVVKYSRLYARVNYQHKWGGVMARTTSITIGAPLDDFIGKLIESGRFGSTSEVVRSALRLLERQENQLAALRAAVEAGERSGESELSLPDIAARVKQQHHV